MSAAERSLKGRVDAILDEAKKFRESGGTEGESLLNGDVDEKLRLIGQNISAEARAAEEAVNAAIAKVNEQYAVLDDRGALSIWNTQRTPSGSYAVYRWQDFERKLGNQYVAVPKGEGEGFKRAPLGTFWLKHPERRDLNGVGFWPVGGEPAGAFNLWQGFAIEPAKAKWPLIREHLLDVICGGDEKVFEYLLKLLAWKVQNPTLPPEVAIIMRSTEEGTGKGTFARIVERFFGHAYRHVSDASHVLGDFNDVLIGALVVFLDEALFAYDPRQMKRFMQLVTEKRLSLNGKFKPVFSWENPMLWLVATNNQKAIDAAVSARRYLVLEVSDCRVGDVDYFTRLNEAIDGTEAQGMLADLLKMDLTGWHPRFDLPKTEGLYRQKLVSLRGPAAFIHEALDKGDAAMLGYTQLAKWQAGEPMRLDGNATLEAWRDRGGEIEVRPADVFDAYREWASRRRDAHGDIVYRPTLQAMSEMLPRRMREKGKGADHNRVWVLPSLAECRDHFEAWTRGELDRTGSISRKFRGK